MATTIKMKTRKIRKMIVSFIFVQYEAEIVFVKNEYFIGRHIYTDIIHDYEVVDNNIKIEASTR